ncbi:hypothetical protein TCAL_03272 [Tigriopus californicus]|uniref:CCHC-type domain-containing protein n=1 Tax=Tigriopus californicus TaxID=6832 RepID=A0A553NVG9_TIGCA|nr:hypothetical protein TCAL_03272 [Tigriopus californicus]|eukprot:TCALIF_03272-PA protein Name:"Protein of unknown function" AED:0.49 eAED:0.49 QI:0/-1/0/1/-1/1/1/0/533
MATEESGFGPDGTDPNDKLGTTGLTQAKSRTEEAFSTSEAVKRLTKTMANKKRAITLQIKTLRADMTNEPQTSRTVLKFKSQALQEVLKELRHVVDEVSLEAEDEVALERYANYWLDEQNRVLEIVGQVEDHVVERLEEASTVFGSSQATLAQFRDTERLRLHNELESAREHEEDAKRRTLEVRNQIDQLQLGDRVRDFEEETMRSPGHHKSWDNERSATSWMRKDSSAPQEPCWIGGQNGIRSELVIFDGEPLNFENWANMFESMVHNTRRSPAEKMGLLRSSLSSECRKVIEGLSNSKADYLEALDVLYKRYGDQRTLQRAHLRALRDLPNVKNGDPRNFPLFADSIQGHLRVVIRMLPKNDGLLTTLMEQLEQKMDREHFNDWDDYAKDIQMGDRIHRFGECAMKKAKRDRYYIGQSNPKYYVGARGWVHELSSSHVDWKGSFRPCKICCGAHKEKDCQRFKDAESKNRRDMARQFGLCYLCLELGHRVSDCPRQKEMECRIQGCHGAHHTWLHIEKIPTRIKEDINEGK